MSVAAGIEGAGAGSGVEGLGLASTGGAGKPAVTGQGMAPTGQVNAESFRSRWQTFLDSLGMEPAELAPRGAPAEENFGPQAAEVPTNELGQGQANPTAPSAAAGLQDGSAPGPVQVRTAGPNQAGLMAGNASAAYRQFVAARDRMEAGSTQAAVDGATNSGQGLKRKADSAAQTSARIAAPDAVAPDLNAMQQIAGLTSASGMLQALPAPLSRAATGFAESFLSGSSFESDGPSAPSGAGARGAPEQEPGNRGAHLPMDATAAGMTPAASALLGGEGRPAFGGGALTQTTGADEAIRSTSDLDSTKRQLHAGGPDATPAAAENQDSISSPLGSYLAAGVGDSLAAAQPGQGTETGDAGSLSAAEIAGGAKLKSTAEPRSSGQVARRSTHTWGVAETARPEAHALSLQAAGVGGAAGAGRDSSILGRDLTVARGTGEVFYEGSASTDGAETGARETFAALDGDAGPGTMSWVHAGAQRAEAGFQDPALGWVSVRADLSGGAVHAAVVAGSSEAAQALGGHMAGLNAYLTEHHAGVASLTMASPDGDAAANGGGNPGAMQQGPGGNAAQSSASEPPADAPLRASSETREIPARSGGMEGAAPEVRQGGHISVMA